ncbi:zinc finger protein 569 [Dendroctonus ponderosae]|uniref:zinc finger protein 569 n=1 Tax=Dendroctonus ponderosae TaxID=77166 RepID=UPI002035363B|nr:zinc finger protein 569 [Dendroctonus ponderosae]XP_019755153.2 zinc finger protein 569 [Dendroctonus ponderosae]XP_019755155.2 zinc finger protein 569 [Dendroctonus ponderosae]
MAARNVAKRELDDGRVKIDPEEAEIIIIESVNDSEDEAHDQIISRENIPHILQNYSKANGNVQLVQLDDGEYSYIIENTNECESGVQYNVTDNDHYIIEEYQEDSEETAAELPEFETMYIESVESPHEVYTLCEEDETSVADEDQEMVVDEESEMIPDKQEVKANDNKSSKLSNIFIKVRKQSTKAEHVSEDQAQVTEEKCINPETVEQDSKTMQQEEEISSMDFLYECGICGKTFSSATGVKWHISASHIDSPAPTTDQLSFSLCACCGEPSDSAHTTGDFNCDECGKLFIYQNSLDRHKSIEHPVGDKYLCYECKKVFCRKDLLVEHTKVHSLKAVKCGDCGREFSRKFHLDRHIGQTGCMGLVKKVYDCRVCNKTFTRKDNLADHLKAHAGIAMKRRKPSTCEFCLKEFSGISLLQIHIRTHTGERPFACDVCEKKFASAGAMTKHRRKHTGEKPYICPQCGSRFAAKETLNRHWRIHTGDKPHKCRFCGKGFIQPSQLRAHIFHHTGENAYNCPHCNRAFNRKLRLTTHIKFMHEGAAPTPCPEPGCGKTFFRKEDIHRHLITHSGERPYECEVCKKRFAVKSSLRVHRNIHRKEAPVSCEVCNRAFIRKDCLMRHMRARHRDVLEDIVTNVEKKRLQTQLFQAVANAANTESLKKSIVWNELTLTESIKELLTLLVDDDCLLELGHPDAPVDRVLETVIRRCGHTPASESDFDYIGKIRENVKLLFTAVIDDNSIKDLLKSHTIDDVIMHVLKLARKRADGTLSDADDNDHADDPDPLGNHTDEDSSSVE